MLARSFLAFSLAGALAAAVTLTPAVARAEDPRSDGSSESRAAATLFYDARALMKKGQLNAACAKFEESLRLDHGIGTEFNLADCNERLGKIATAWSGFQRVAAFARTANQPERERIARARANALEAILPRLVIEVPSPEPALEVKVDGRPVSPDRWGAPLPVDPGMRAIVASAPGREPYRISISAARGAVARVTIPRALPAGAVALVPAAPANDAVTSETTLTSAALSSEDVRDPRDPRDPHDPREPAADRGRAQRTASYVIGGVGLAGVGIAAAFGLDSIAKSDRASSHCAGDVCDAEGVGLRDDALRSGDVATVSAVLGGAALASGIFLLVTAPSASPGRRAAPATAAPAPRRIAAAPFGVAGGGGISLQGTLP